MLRVADDAGPPPIPTHIRVGPYRYRVIIDTDDDMPPENIGQIEYDSLLISLRSTLAHDRTVIALYHEVFHACWEVGLGGTKKKRYKKETVIERLTPHLLAVLRDNPDLVAYLCDTTDLPVAT